VPALGFQGFGFIVSIHGLLSRTNCRGWFECNSHHKVFAVADPTLDAATVVAGSCWATIGAWNEWVVVFSARH
jgi:hypothetical protein